MKLPRLDLFTKLDLFILIPGNIVIINEEIIMKKPPEKYVYFHKTHKCSSTTIQNILFRYAMNNDLILVLPKHGGHFTFKSYKFNAQMVQDTAWMQA